MRRSDKEIADRPEINEIIHGCHVCHLALAVNTEPYVVPVSFGLEGESVYFHTAKHGKKIDMMTSNPRVCVQFERGVELVADGDDACSWTFCFESVIGFGTVVELLDEAEKTRGLNHIMMHYSGRIWSFEERSLASTRVWRIDLDELTGKRSGRKE
ncbi:MAG: pyridoxamine 5'-phosphate oxidase family protein [Thermoanaerobaculales bacterium]|jgi:nitroimidazol reductase NimA-like FMN-containing flavoprotein (pyridoxamine 5'-phosphate oxidase superfamily)|nr:pyridoxamine 5'-phosphate oxidase family protein [Thermoanaerobaculales bacterium]